MMADQGEVTFEVHVQQGGRWEIQARYTGDKKDKAIQDAQVLDKMPGIDAVRVIRETFDPGDNLSKEATVYTSEGGKKGGSAPVGGGGGSASGGGSSRGSASSGSKPSSRSASPARSSGSGRNIKLSAAEAEKQKQAKALARQQARQDEADRAIDAINKQSGAGGSVVKRKSSLLTVLVKIMLMILFAVVIGGTFAYFASVVVAKTSLGSNAQSNTVLVVFLAAFLLTASSMVYSLLQKVQLTDPSKKKTPPPKPAANKARVSKVALKKAKAERIDPEERKKWEEEEKAANEAANAAEKALKESGKEDADSEEEAKEEKEEDEAEEEAEEKSSALTKHGEKQKVVMMKFLGETLKHAQNEGRKLDSFNKFGVNLFLAGGCEIMAEAKNVDPRDATKILREGVTVMGFKDADAEKFAESYEEYLLADSRYMQMFQAGRNAMNTYFADEADVSRQISQALDDWNKPKQKDETTGPVTVMFTDISGSTAMTQSLGDAGAQQVVRAHNRVVREALTKFAGKEIKHTGDGIMASFSTTSNGAEAAAEMQRRVREYTAANPDLPLHIKIGINAGEPISEDDDLFGTTVQMAARIVDKAQADQIFVSEIVRGICAGKNLKFLNCGGFPMKGFADDIVLYELIWSESAADEPADAASA